MLYDNLICIISSVRVQGAFFGATTPKPPWPPLPTLDSSPPVVTVCTCNLAVGITWVAGFHIGLGSSLEASKAGWPLKNHEMPHFSSPCPANAEKCPWGIKAVESHLRLGWCYSNKGSYTMWFPVKREGEGELPGTTEEARRMFSSQVHLLLAEFVTELQQGATRWEAPFINPSAESETREGFCPHSWVQLPRCWSNCLVCLHLSCNKYLHPPGHSRWPTLLLIYLLLVSVLSELWPLPC